MQLPISTGYAENNFCNIVKIHKFENLLTQKKLVVI